jgi:hypothetical protein
MDIARFTAQLRRRVKRTLWRLRQDTGYLAPRGRWQVRLLFLIFLFINSESFSEQVKQAPQIKSEQQPNSALKPQVNGKSDPTAANKQVAPVPSFHTPVADGKSHHESNQSQEEGTEFWPPLWGYRLKVTDTMLVVFTFLRFLATLALYRATRNLVLGAKKASERQLRSYLSMNPHSMGGFFEGGITRIGFLPKNHGQTPAYRIHHIFDSGVLPNPLPAGFQFPPPIREIRTEFTSFPNSPTDSTWFNGESPLTKEEVTLVTADKAAFWCWGKTSYRDIFGKERGVLFYVSAGGKDFVTFQAMYRAGKRKGLPEWHWNYGHRHGEEVIN